VRPARRGEADAFDELDSQQSLGPYSALGQSFAVRAQPGLLDCIEPLVAPLASDRASTATQYTVVEQKDAEYRYHMYRDRQRVATVPFLGRIVSGLFWCIDRDIAATPPEGKVLLHAAAVEANGRAVVLPGASGSGKSTLAAHLVREGMRYLTDEIGAISAASCEVEPYAKPLMLKPGSWALFPELEPPPLPGPIDPDSPWAIAPGEFRADAVAPVSPLAAVVFPEYRHGHDGEFARVPPADALTALAECVFATPADSPGLLRALADIVRRTPCYRAHYGRLEWVNERIQAAVSRLSAR
jgi:hypothetical protein